MAQITSRRPRQSPPRRAGAPPQAPGPADDQRSRRSPYLDALAMLARRELSEAQLRLRLARRGHEASAVDEAISRLAADGSLNDERTALVLARAESVGRGRGPLRVRRRLEAAGIAAEIADRAVDAVFQELDADQLLASALESRLRRGEGAIDSRRFARLYRSLVAQGFEPGRVLAALRARLPAARDR